MEEQNNRIRLINENLIMKLPRQATHKISKSMTLTIIIESIT